MIAVIGCSKNEVIMYDDAEKDGIFIQQRTGTSYNSSGIITSSTYSDSSTISLVNYAADRKEFTLSVPIQIMGKVSNVDRTVAFKINKELTTAIEGEDFQINYDTLRVLAGANKATLRIKIIRTPKLQKKEVCIAVELVENENFKIYFKTFKSNNPVVSTSVDLSAVVFKFKVSDMPKEPYPDWIFYGKGLYGKWTVNKFNLINSTMGWTSAGWDKFGDPGPYPNYGKINISVIIIREIVQKAADSGTPILDDDGTYMQFPEPNNIDYSKYEKQ